MKSMITALAFAFCVLANAGMPAERVFWSTPTVPGKVTTSGTEIHFTGDIDAVIATTIVDLIRRDKYDTLKLESDGGDVLAARSIGVALFDHQMTVVVTGPCRSSCARYIFTAAKQKRIEPDAFVMFSEHQSYRDYVQNLIQLSEKLSGNDDSALSGEEKKALYFGKKWVKLEEDYFTKIGVDIGITRLGYVPGRSVSYWLLSGNRMAEFGVSNVSLPDNYASQEYCDKMKISGIVRFDAQCL
jgi:hypothetical protein